MVNVAFHWTDGVVALGLGLGTIALVSSQGLGLGRSLAWAWARAIAQLGVLAYGLAIVITLPYPWVTLGALGVLAGLLGFKLHHTLDRHLSPLGLAGMLGWRLLLPWGYGVWGGAGVGFGEASPYGLGLGLVMGLVMAGMMVDMGGRAGEQVLQALKGQRLDIEARLSLGATVAQALEPHRSQGVRSILLPWLSHLPTLGLVTVPPLWAGMVLAGMDPLVALGYQSLLWGLGLWGGVSMAVGVSDRLVQRVAPQMLEERFQPIAR